MSEFDALCANDAGLAQLRTSIREFLTADRADFGWQPAVDSWLAKWDPDFSARLADAGFVGLTIPAEYGGRGLGYLHRYVVTEELLAHGRFEQDSVELVADLLDYVEDAEPLRTLVSAGRVHSPLFTLRGGTNEVLRGVVARGMGVR